MERPRRFLCALVALMVLGGCRQGQTPSSRARNNQSMADSELKMTAMKIQSYADGGMEWELSAPYGEMFTSKNFMRLTDMDIHLFEKGQKSTEIKANVGVMSTGAKDPKVANSSDKLFGVHLEDGDMYMSGDVVMVSTDGSKLTTDWVHYHKKTELITSTAPVRVVRSDSITNGVGLEASSDLSRLQIFNQTLLIPEKKQ